MNPIGGVATAATADPTRRPLAWAVLIAALAFATAALAAWTIDPDDALAFWLLFRRFEVVGSGLALALLLLAAALARRRAGQLAEAIVARLAAFPRAITVAAVALLAIGARFVYHAHPLSMDEYVALFQARVFAAGRLTGHFPPALLDWLVPPVARLLFFEVSPVSGRIAEIHWPGFALLLTPFVVLGVPWACNAVLAGAALLLLANFARRTLDDDEAAGWALVIAIGSAAFVVDAISYYSMTAHLLANLAFASLLLAPRRRRLFAAGLVGGFACTLNQPYPHFLFALPWIAELARGRGRGARLALLALGYLPGVLGGVLGWVALRGSIRRDGGAALSGVATAAGGAAGRFLSQATRMLAWPSVELGWARTLGYIKLMDWAVPGLLVLAWCGWRSCRHREPMGRVGASFALTVVGYWFTPPGNTQGHGWGFRYLHSTWWALPIFAAALVARWNPERRSWRPLVAVLALLGLVISVPVHLVEVERWIAQHLAQGLPRTGAGRELHLLDNRQGFYVRDLAQNDPFLRDPVIVGVSQGEERDRAMVQVLFPGARVTIADRRGTAWSLPDRQP